MIKANYILFGLLFVGLYSCKRDAPSKVDVGYNYYPNEVGSWIIYDVDSDAEVIDIVYVGIKSEDTYRP